MNQDPRWVGVLLGRVVAYAILGGLPCALLGALLISASGASVGLVLEPTLRPNDLFPEIVRVGAAIGAFFGFCGAGVIGLIGFGLIGFMSPRRPSYLPPRTVLIPTLIAMSLAAVAIMTSFYILMATIAILRHIAFHDAVGEGLSFIMFGAPIIMVCGQIVGLSRSFKRERNSHEAASPLPPLLV
ncbi:hypothetical protein EON80_00775 [bacterium]|nr:MAG: hypothetical protein EON80_00775 [bacterium]